MNRRDAVLALLALLALGAAPVAAEQQPAKLARIGYLGYGNPESAGNLVDAFKQGMRELGYVDRKNVVFEMRWALGRAESLQNVAAELVKLKVDVIVTGNTPATLAAQRATKTIPIVAIAVADPLGSGLVASLARPDGNTTGLSLNLTESAPKYLELLQTMVPTASRIAVLVNPDNSSNALVLKSLRGTAQKIGVQILAVEARAAEDIEGKFGGLVRQRVEAVIVASDPLFFTQRQQIVEAVIRYRLPSIFQQRDYVEIGGLMSYGQSLTELYRRAATYVDKILKGAKAGDLPVEQPNIFELVVNTKTADALGLTVPRELLLRADRVIE